MSKKLRGQARAASSMGPACRSRHPAGLAD